MGCGGLPIVGIPSKGDFKAGTLAFGSKSLTLGVFIINQPLSKHIIRDSAGMFRR